MPEANKPFPKSEWVLWLTTFFGVVLLAGLLWLVDLKWLHDGILKLNGVAVFGAVTLLPLIGVPVSLLYAVTGAKFGPLAGLAVVAVATAIQLVMSWWISHSWVKQPLETFLKRKGVKIPAVPDGADVQMCLVVALMPGLSYALKNYLLALGGVALRPYFWTLLPAHLIHASLGLFIGDFAGEMTTSKVVFLAAYAVVLIGLSHFIYRRVKRRSRANAAAGVQDSPS